MKKEDNFERIYFELTEYFPGDRVDRKISFVGRWIVQDVDEYIMDLGEWLHVFTCSVAISEKGKLLTFYKVTDDTVFNDYFVYESFDELVYDSMFSPRVISKIAKEIGIEYVEKLDV